MLAFTGVLIRGTSGLASYQRTEEDLAPLSSDAVSTASGQAARFRKTSTWARLGASLLARELVGRFYKGAAFSPGSTPGILLAGYGQDREPLQVNANALGAVLLFEFTLLSSGFEAC